MPRRKRQTWATRPAPSQGSTFSCVNRELGHGSHSAVPARRGITEAPPPRARTWARWLGKLTYTRASSLKGGLVPSGRRKGCSMWCHPQGAGLVHAVPHRVGRGLPNGPSVWQLVAGDEEATPAGTLLAALPGQRAAEPVGATGTAE